jgi:hypothetical protein
MSDRRKARRIEASAFVLRDAAGRKRAVLACGSRSAGSAVRLVLFDAGGRAALTLSVDRRGRASVAVGPRDRGRAVLIDRRGVELWRGGNAFVALLSDRDGGRLFLHDKDGGLRRVLPRR